MAEADCATCDTAEVCVDACGCALPLAAPGDGRLRQWAWWLTGLTIGWNTLEAAVAILSGLAAGSIALVGFGLDSVVEVSSAVIIAWRLTRQSADHAANERAERRAVMLIALSFFAIAAYVTFDAALKLLGLTSEAERSPLGLLIVLLSLLVMPTLAWAKRHVAARLGSVALRADAAETQLCTYLSAVVLVALGANALWGWWWLDPVAGLVIAGIAVREGLGAWRSGDLCCD
ncbi:MAG TPA: cation transporter [Chloroflexota bacterium]|jgi:divalent metal cation (Fe/Co/Zn/Cd) transporter